MISLTKYIEMIEKKHAGVEYILKALVGEVKKEAEDIIQQMREEGSTDWERIDIESR